MKSTQGKLRGVWGWGEAEVGYAEAGSDSTSEEYNSYILWDELLNSGNFCPAFMENNVK